MEKFKNVNNFNPEHKDGQDNDCLKLGKTPGAQIESPMQNLGWGPDNKMIGPAQRKMTSKDKSDFINF